MLLLAVLGTMVPADAFAYLDPGTGSLIVQSVIATLAAVAYGLRLYWSRIQVLMRRTPDRGHSKPGDGRPPGGAPHRLRAVGTHGAATASPPNGVLALNGKLAAFLVPVLTALALLYQVLTDLQVTVRTMRRWC